MLCPRCESTILDEIDRSGVTIDRCASCRGIWLDRGELEKIIARASQEYDRGDHRDHDRGDHRDHSHREQHGHHEHHGHSHDRHHGYDREPPSSRPSHRGHKKSFWHELFD